MMSKKWLIGIIIPMIVCSAVLIGQVSSDTIAQPVRLAISVSPSSIPSDNRTYDCIFVELQDSSGNPARAQEDTIISLSSSLTEIGTVNPTVTIEKNATYVATNFYAAFTPGTTTITAAATGYAAVQAPVTTVGPKPYTLGVYGFPSTLPADGGVYAAIMVQLQDASLSPAKAPKGGTQVALSCSDTTVGDVTANVTIPEGQTYAIADFTTTGNPGEAVVTAIAGDYGSTDTTITTMEYTPASSGKLVISTGPTKVLADNTAYKQVAVQIVYHDEILDRDFLGAAASNIAVTIASADESIGKTETQLIIPASQTYALATFNSTYKAGITTITAAATNFAAASQQIIATGYTASKLSVYCVPSVLPADKGVYQTVQVQLQDAQGRPAKAPVDLTVNLFSSQPTVAAVSPTVTIPLGETGTTGTLIVTNAEGETEVTAQASGYTTGQETVAAYTLDYSKLAVTLTSNPQSIPNGNRTEVTAYVTAEGSPVTGASVIFASSNGGNFTGTRAGEAGYYITNFTTPSFSKTTTCTITANASKAGFIASQGIVQITVGPTITAASNSSTATLQLCILDSAGSGLNDVLVSSTVQPQGAHALLGITNETGYVTFRNVTVGSYSLQITKAGYATIDQPIDFNGKPLALALTLYGGGAQGDNTLVLVGIVVIFAVIFAVIGIVLVRRRKTSKASTPLSWPSTL